MTDTLVVKEQLRRKKQGTHTQTYIDIMKKDDDDDNNVVAVVLQDEEESSFDA